MPPPQSQDKGKVFTLSILAPKGNLKSTRQNLFSQCFCSDLVAAPSSLSKQPSPQVLSEPLLASHHSSLWKDLASPVAQIVKKLFAMKKTQDWSLGCEDPLEEEMATHSSILAWRPPWTEEPGGLKSMGSQRVGHDWATNTKITYRTQMNSMVQSILSEFLTFSLTKRNKCQKDLSLDQVTR